MTGMKNLIIALIAFLPGSLVAGVDFKIADPIAYNDYLVDQQKQIGDAINEFVTAFSDNANGYDELLVALEKVSGSIRASIKLVEDLESFEGDDTLRQSSLSLFRFYRTIIKRDYGRILDITFKKEVPIDSDTEINKIINTLTEEEKVFDAAFSRAEEAFAQKHHFTLTKE